MTWLHPAWPTAVFVALVAWRLRPRPSRPLRGHTTVSSTWCESTWCQTPSVASVASPSASGHNGWSLTPSIRILRRRQPPTAADAAAWCDAISRELRAGATLAAAVADAECPVRVDALAAPVRAALARGDGLRHALHGEHDRLAGEPSMRMVLMVLSTLAEHGGPAAEPIDRAAAALRVRDAADAERASQSAQARWSAAAMTLLPLGTLCLLIATSASVRGVVVTPVGASVVAVGCALNAVGWWWMRRIVAGGRQ